MVALVDALAQEKDKAAFIKSRPLEVRDLLEHVNNVAPKVQELFESVPTGNRPAQTYNQVKSAFLSLGVPFGGSKPKKGVDPNKALGGSIPALKDYIFEVKKDNPILIGPHCLQMRAILSEAYNFEEEL